MQQVKAIAFRVDNGAPNASDAVYVIYSQPNPMTDAVAEAQQTLSSPSGMQTGGFVRTDDVPVGSQIQFGVGGGAARQADEINWYDAQGNLLGSGPNLEMVIEDEGTQTITAELIDQDTGQSAEASVELNGTPTTGMAGYYNNP